LDEITSVLYRRGGIKFKRFYYENEGVNIHMNETQHWLEEYVMQILESKKHLNKQSNSHVNKLLVLDKAKKVGLDVPDYYLSNNTQNVKLGRTITKPIAGNPIIQSIAKNTDGILYTAIVDEYIKNDFFISFFQEKIEKDFPKMMSKLKLTSENIILKFLIEMLGIIYQKVLKKKFIC